MTNRGSEPSVSRTACRSAVQSQDQRIGARLRADRLVLAQPGQLGRQTTAAARLFREYMKPQVPRDLPLTRTPQPTTT